MVSLEGETVRATLSKFTGLKKLYIVWRFDPKDVLYASFIKRYASKDNDNKIVLTPEEQLYCSQQYFESPHLWLNQLPGVEAELVYVRVESVNTSSVAAGEPLGCDAVNESLQNLENYFTPGGYARRIDTQKRYWYNLTLADEIDLARSRRQEEKKLQQIMEKSMQLDNTNYNVWETDQLIGIARMALYMNETAKET